MPSGAVADGSAAGHGENGMSKDVHTSSRKPDNPARSQDMRIAPLCSALLRTSAAIKLGVIWPAGRKGALSTRTVRERLVESGLQVCRKHHQWVDAIHEWVSEWRHILFSHESRIELSGGEGRILVRRKSGKHLFEQSPAMCYSMGCDYTWRTNASAAYTADVDGSTAAVYARQRLIASRACCSSLYVYGCFHGRQLILRI